MELPGLNLHELGGPGKGKSRSDFWQVSKELDGDVILAAQALQANAVIATENPGHLTLFAEAGHWRDLSLPYLTALSADQKVK